MSQTLQTQFYQFYPCSGVPLVTLTEDKTCTLTATGVSPSCTYDTVSGLYKKTYCVARTDSFKITDDSQRGVPTVHVEVYTSSTCNLIPSTKPAFNYTVFLNRFGNTESGAIPLPEGNGFPLANRKFGQAICQNESPKFKTCDSSVMFGNCNEVSASSCFPLSQDAMTYYGKAKCVRPDQQPFAMTGGAVAGVVIGSLVVFVIFFIALGFFLRKKGYAQNNNYFWSPAGTPGKPVSQTTTPQTLNTVNYGQPLQNGQPPINTAAMPYGQPVMNPGAPMGPPAYNVGAPVVYGAPAQVMYVQPQPGMYAQPAVLATQPVTYAYVQPGMPPPPPS